MILKRQRMISEKMEEYQYLIPWLSRIQLVLYEVKNEIISSE